MAELLKRWVNGLGTSPITNFERDLSNGFCFGEILAHPDYDLLTAESFAAFMANDSAEAKVQHHASIKLFLRLRALRRSRTFSCSPLCSETWGSNSTR